MSSSAGNSRSGRKPKPKGRSGRPAGSAPPTARDVALEVLVRIETRGAYANLALPVALKDSGLSQRDRAFATELVYGVTRRRRALDWIINRRLKRPPPAPARAALRMGAYQLTELGLPKHAAISETVSAAPKGLRPLVNAVLRRVAESDPVEWPDEATRLSYPDWIVQRLSNDLGQEQAVAVLEAMNQPARRHRRPDGYTQDPSSQQVVATVCAVAGGHADAGDAVPLSQGGVRAGAGLVADLCAAPGGKATAFAGRGFTVVCVDTHRARLRRTIANRRTVGLAEGSMPVLNADGRFPPLRQGCFDVVLVDAPCSGLGVLRRRPDARWRITEDAIERLTGQQGELLDAAAGLVRPGGVVAYSVCTLTNAETVEVAASFSDRTGLQPVTPLPEPWQAKGTGGLLLPDEKSDGMALFAWRRK